MGPLESPGELSDGVYSRDSDQSGMQREDTSSRK